MMFRIRVAWLVAGVLTFALAFAPSPQQARAALTPDQQSKADAALIGLWKNNEASRSTGVAVGEIEAALNAGANINAKDNDGQTALMLAAGRSNPDCINFLISKGADVNTRDNDGSTALMLAANNGSLDCVKLLISKNADVNAKASRGYTPLMEAAMNVHAECVRFLVSAGADVDAQNNNGDTALIMAEEMASQWNNISDAPEGSLDCIKFLASKSKRINTPDKYGRTALSRAHRQPEIVAVLKAAGAVEPVRDRKAKANASLLGLWPVDQRGYYVGQKSTVTKSKIAAALAHGADINARDPDNGDTALMRASEADNGECVRFLIQKRANLNAMDFEHGWTALMFASFYGNVDCAKILIAGGASVSVRSLDNGQTALAIAAQQLYESSMQGEAEGQAGIVDCMKLLLAHGADVNTKDNDGSTPLMMVVIGHDKGNADATKLLVSKGADVNAKDKTGSTPLSLAKTPSIIAILKAAGAK